ncbi:hypothetical protein [Streptacidiphilus carbonis]|jgi:hypothetical protein|uniref:hypothetical protein n=1 Tax=Streptacidiphilus carbonis TaxID=105422 RepID=UPI0005A96599|nr:hypothetical protein [Streptacidiphilus carbonis]
MRPRAPATLLLITALLGPAGCGSAGTGTHTAPTAAPTVTLDDRSSGRTVTIPAGGTVDLVLHSTYWSGPRSSAPDALQPLGTALTSPAPGCVPGQGCGTVTARFQARTTGRATLTATRTTCGEALLCTPAQRTFTATVLITAG